MGNGTSSSGTDTPPWIHDVLTDEYAQAKNSESSPPTDDEDDDDDDDDDVDGLTLTQFLTINLDRLMPLPLLDVAILVLADRDCDGVYSLPDLLAFSSDIYASYCNYSSQGLVPGEKETVRSLVLGELTRRLWSIVAVSPNGIQEVSERITTILTRNRPTQTFATQPGVYFVNSDTVHTCFRMCAVARSKRLDFQSFFDLMQQAAEDQGLMDLEDALLDNMLPLQIVTNFLQEFLAGVSRMQVGAAATTTTPPPSTIK